MQRFTQVLRYSIINHAVHLGRGRGKVKTFFAIIFYSTLIVMYSKHLIESYQKFNNTYNNVNQNKRKETLMKKQTIITISQTRKSFYPPENH